MVPNNSVTIDARAVLTYCNVQCQYSRWEALSFSLLANFYRETRHRYFRERAGHVSVGGGKPDEFVANETATARMRSSVFDAGAGHSF